MQFYKYKTGELRLNSDFSMKVLNWPSDYKKNETDYENAQPREDTFLGIY